MGALETLGVVVRELGPHGMSMWQANQQTEMLKKSHEIQMEHLKKIGDATGVSPAPKKECPTCHLPSVKVAVGNKTWKLLHGLPETMGGHPDKELQDRYAEYVKAICTNLPCRECAENATRYIEDHPIDASSSKALSEWLCSMHNDVSERLGKETHSCSR